MSTYSMSGPAGTLKVASQDMTMEMIEALRDGSVEWSTGAVSELKLSLEDRRRQILNSGLIDPGRADGMATGTTITLGTKNFETRSLEHTDDGTLVIQARSPLVCKMNRAIGVEVTAGPISPSAWIARAVNKAGGRCHAQESPSRDQITRQENESDWDVCLRLAKEEGFLCYEVDDIVSFGKPTWLIQRPGYKVLNVDITEDANGLPVPVDGNILTKPSPRRSSDASEVCEWQITITRELVDQIGTIGFGAKLTGYPPFDGLYLIDRLSFPLHDQGVATLHATTPVDPEPSGAEKKGVGVGTTSASAITAPAPGRYGNVPVSQEMANNAFTIIKVGLSMGVPAKGLAIALATAMQESGIKNLNYGDRDSLGLFQQRPSQGWGSPAQVRDPAYAARKFFEALLKVPNWQSMALTVAAQAVQRSGFPDAYAKYEAMANALVKSTLSTASKATTVIKDQSNAASIRTAKVIAAARSKIGLPYIFGGTGPSGYDCSGLVQYAWGVVGFQLPRVTTEMLKDRRLQSVTQANLQPGDLVFPHTGHVQLYIGGGRVIEAQKPGTNVLEGPMWGFKYGRRVP